MAQNIHYSPNPAVSQVIGKLLVINACPLPVTPVKGRDGKAPSFKDGDRRKLVEHGLYQTQRPTEEEIHKWFTNNDTYAGMLCGIDGNYWIDFDSKDYYPDGKKQWEADGRPYFDSEDCNNDALSTIERIREASGQEPWVERTGSGGWHIAVHLDRSPEFTNFSTEAGGTHRGEVLGSGRFCILAPAIHPDTGKPYELVQDGVFAAIESLEAISIYSIRKTKKICSPNLTLQVGLQTAETPQVVNLEDCPGDCTRARKVMQGALSDDRSADLTCVAKELYGWENWLSSKGFNYHGSTENLIRGIAPQDIDGERVSRILATINRTECLPACVMQSGDESAFKRIDKLTGHYSRSGKTRPYTSAEPVAIESSTPLWWQPEITDHQICDVKHDKQGNIIHVPLTNFDLSIERILQAPKDSKSLSGDGDDGGYVFKLTRRLGDNLQHDSVTIHSVELTRNTDFTNALKRQLGANITSVIGNDKLQHLIHYLETQYYQTGGKCYKLADRFGQQYDGTWVFEDIQFTATGEITTAEESGWVFNSDISSEEHIPSPKILPPDDKVLRQLMDATSNFFSPEVMPYAVICLGWATMHANYQQVFKQEKFFPALDITGEIGGGKTTILTIMASLFGLSHLVTKFTESMVYEMLKRCGSIPVLLDDPIPPGKKGTEVKDKLDDCVWKAYNGHARIVRGNHQQPHSSLGVASNKGIGASGNTAVDTRMIRINWPSTGSRKQEAWSGLQEVIKNASKAFPSLIFEYQRDEVDILTTELIQAMPRSHARMARNLAILVWFTQQLCDRAGVSFNALEQCKELLVPSADDLESGRSSLQDFIEYLKHMKTDGQLGEHLAVLVTPREDNQRFVAIYLQSVWAEIETRYAPNFGIPGLKTLVQEAGGYQKSAKFVSDRVAWNDYLREKHAFERNSYQSGVQAPQKPPRIAVRKALFIPEVLFGDESSDEVI